MPSAAASRYLPGLSPHRPTRRRRPAQKPPLWHFVFLSMLLHTLLITLFGAPSGGSREGRAMWGSLEVVLPGSFPDSAASLRVDRSLGTLPRLSPVPPPEPEKRVQPAPPPPAVELSVTKDIGRRILPEAPPEPAPAEKAPPAEVSVPTPAVEAPPVFPPLLDRRPAPEPRTPSPPALKVPPPTEQQGIPPPRVPEPVPEARVPQDIPPAPPARVAEPPPTPAEAPAPEPAREPTPRVERAIAEEPPIPAPVLQPVPPAPPEPRATPPLERPPVEVPSLPVFPAESVPQPRVEPAARPPELAPAPEAPVPASVPPAIERAEPRAPEVPSPQIPAPAKAERELPARAEPEAPPSPAMTPPPAVDSLPGRRDAPPATGRDPAAPRIDLDSMRKRAGQIAREGTGNRAILSFPMPPLPERKSKLESDLEKARKPDCKTAYQGLGLAAIVPLIANEFGEGNCRW